jgi:hypothetical protein
MSLMAAAIQGLPPLPKSLSGLLSFNRESLSREAVLRNTTGLQQQGAASDTLAQGGQDQTQLQQQQQLKRQQQGRNSQKNNKIFSFFLN